MMKRIYKYLLLILLFQLLTFSLNLNTDQLISTEYPNKTGVIEELIETNENEVLIFKKNNIVFKIFESSKIEINDIKKIKVHNGIIMYFDRNKYSNDEIENANIKEELFLTNEEGKFQFYRLRIPKEFKTIETNINIIYQLEDKKKEFHTILHLLFVTKEHKYYGTFIPFNVYWDIKSYRVNVNIYKKKDLFVKISTLHSVKNVEWGKQTLYFKKSKSKELKESNMDTYYKEHKIRKDIWNKNNKKYFFSNGFQYPLIDHQYITSDFGLIREWRLYNRRLYSKSIHLGVDMAHLKNTVVYAPADGIIRYAQNGEFVGNTIIIEHGLGLYTDYSHMEKILVKKGTRVKKGDIVGLVGSTGAATGSHLHWGARIFMHPVDPKELIGIEEIFIQ